MYESVHTCLWYCVASFADPTLFSIAAQPEDRLAVTMTDHCWLRRSLVVRGSEATHTYVGGFCARIVKFINHKIISGMNCLRKESFHSVVASPQ